MRKNVETGLTVIAAHAAASHTAKGQMGIGELEDGIIYAAGAERGFIDDLLTVFTQVRKDVERQGFRPGINGGYHCGQIVKFQDRQNRAKDFILHNRIIP